MLISLGPQAFVPVTPVFLVGTYDEDGRPDIMPAAWGGVCSTQPPCLAVSLRRSRWTWRSIQLRRAFTVSIPDRVLAGETDFAGLVSGRSEDKFRTLGLTPCTGDHVDAPYVGECPVILELQLRHTLELGSHVQVVGEIMDVKVRQDCLTPEKLPDAGAVDALTYVPLAQEYRSTGEFVARAFAVGKTVKRHGDEERQ